MVQPQTQIGAYTLISQIGRGGFGVVWLAEKRTAITTTRFALKLARNEDVDIEVFKQEAAIWAQVSGHPNVLPIIEADIHDGQIVIVSEYAPGGSLQEWLHKHGGQAPSIEAAIEMTKEILDGLEHLHEQQIIHRDLKPDNILLQRETPRLADFGIARVIKTDSYSKAVSGTFAYMAPEAFEGKRNKQTDVWSVGVILYRMLAGSLPYCQEDIVSLVGAILRHDPPPLPASVPESLRSIVSRALQRDPAERYRSAAEMRQDLRVVSHELWQPQRPETDFDRTMEPETRRNVPPPVTIPVEPRSHPQPSAMPPQVEFISPPQPTIAAREMEIVPPQPTAVASPGLPAAPAAAANTAHHRGSRTRRNVVIGVGAVTGLLLFATAIVLAIYQWRQFGETEQKAGTTAASEQFVKYNLKQTLAGHSGSIIPLAFSPDGKQLASGSMDKTIKIWDAQSGALKRTINGHNDGVHALAFSPDGTTLASGSDDRSIKLWNARTGAPVKTFTGNSSDVHTLAFSPNGKQLASGSTDKLIKLWDVESGEVTQTFTGHTGVVKVIAFSPDGEQLASGSDDKTIKFWDVQTGALIQTLTGHDKGIHGVAFSPDGKTLASGSIDRTIKLWDVQTGTLNRTLIGHTDGVHALAVSSDGKTLASGSNDQTIKLWDTRTGELKETLEGHSDMVMSVKFSPDSKQLASGSMDKTIKLWAAL